MINYDASKEKIARILKERGYSAGALAKLLTVSEQAAYAWLSGRNFPSIDNLVRIAQLTGVSVDELLVLKTE